MTPVVERDLILAPLASADRVLRAFSASHPEFDGQLVVEADARFNGFWLILTGAFARPTARALLREIRVEIEADARTQNSKGS